MEIRSTTGKSIDPIKIDGVTYSGQIWSEGASIASVLREECDEQMTIHMYRHEHAWLVVGHGVTAVVPVGPIGPEFVSIPLFIGGQRKSLRLACRAGRMVRRTDCACGWEAFADEIVAALQVTGIISQEII